MWIRGLIESAVLVSCVCSWWHFLEICKCILHLLAGQYSWVQNLVLKKKRIGFRYVAYWILHFNLSDLLHCLKMVLYAVWLICIHNLHNLHLFIWIALRLSLKLNPKTSKLSISMTAAICSNVARTMVVDFSVLLCLHTFSKNFISSVKF